MLNTKLKSRSLSFPSFPPTFHGLTWCDGVVVKLVGFKQNSYRWQSFRNSHQSIRDSLQKMTHRDIMIWKRKEKIYSANDFENFTWNMSAGFKVKVCWDIFVTRFMNLFFCSFYLYGGGGGVVHCSLFYDCCHCLQIVFKWPQICHMLWCEALLRSYLNPISSFFSSQMS